MKIRRKGFRVLAEASSQSVDLNVYASIGEVSVQIWISAGHVVEFSLTPDEAVKFGQMVIQSAAKAREAAK